MNLHRLDPDDFAEHHMEPVYRGIHPEAINALQDMEDQTDGVTLWDIIKDIAPAVLITLGSLACVFFLAGCGGGDPDEPELVCKTQVASPTGKASTTYCGG